MAEATWTYPAVNNAIIYNRQPLIGLPANLWGNYYSIDGGEYIQHPQKQDMSYPAFYWPTPLSYGTHTLRGYQQQFGVPMVQVNAPVRTFTIVNPGTLSLSDGQSITDESSVDKIIPLVRNILKYYGMSTSIYPLIDQDTPMPLTAECIGQILTALRAVPFDQMVLARPTGTTLLMADVNPGDRCDEQVLLKIWDAIQQA